MTRLFARVAFTVLAFACAWGWSALAMASGDSICAAPELRSFVLEQEPTCLVVVSTDDEGNTSAAPLCDPRGASAIAPERVFPVSDARIDAGPPCAGGALTDSTAVALYPDHHGSGSPDGSLFHPVTPATLSVEPIVGLGYFTEITYSTAPERQPSDGVSRGIDRPPSA